MKLKAGNTIYLSGKTDFGRQFVKENGSRFRVVKVQTWAEDQLLLKNRTRGCEVELIWINLFPTSKNFTIDKVEEDEEDEESESKSHHRYKWWEEDMKITDSELKNGWGS